MLDKNIEMMKKIIEQKKMKSSQQGSNKRAIKSIGGCRKANRSNKKTGGLFDK
ncbi:hypothetical protein [Clostridium rectalis]|uniref:hypothetical protein n=1 Tax=Clostridium rectalis TaxID=2040295 RepID=UPI0013DE014A|nr:hypothetical protein [Clostridium rectalis]